MSRPFQLGIHASPAISVTTNGPTPDLDGRGDRVRRRVDTAIAFCADLRHPDLPADDGGVAERAVPSCDRRDDGCSSPGRCARRPVVVVTQTASPEAAVQPRRPATGIVATTLFVAGSMRTTPSLPVAQIEPNAPTTPVADGACSA